MRESVVATDMESADLRMATIPENVTSPAPGVPQPGKDAPIPTIIDPCKTSRKPAPPKTKAQMLTSRRPEGGGVLKSEGLFKARSVLKARVAGVLTSGGLKGRSVLISGARRA